MLSSKMFPEKGKIFFPKAYVPLKKQNQNETKP